MKLLISLFGLAAVASSAPAAHGVGVETSLEALPSTALEPFPGATSEMATARDTSFGFFFTATEYCAVTDRKMTAQWKNSHDRTLTEFMDISDPSTTYFVQTPVGRVQLRMDSAKSLVHFHFRTCDWAMNKFDRKACGWCISTGWNNKAQQPDCTSGQPTLRIYKATCMFDFGKYLLTRDNVPEVDNELLLDIRPTATKAHDVADAVAVAAAASTVTEHAQIIAKPAPNAGTTIILPFHITITDYCEGGHRRVEAIYTNGDRCIDNLRLNRRETQSIQHKITNYPDLTIGAFNWDTNRLRFAYKDCTWYDNETWKACGECRAAQWSGPTPDCAAGNDRMRTKEIDCSTILGITYNKPSSDYTPPPPPNDKHDITLPPVILLPNNTVANGHNTLDIGNSTQGIINGTLMNTTSSQSHTAGDLPALGDGVLASVVHRDGHGRRTSDDDG
ncbi:hypothetical protein T440DRAFT_429426 [Plenodomus tracheiphilus IPT5]|uniref:Lytic polysaccharide monooxygenase n=1 Tax=Plenodomus tracheiphilus IPT5 TaxID=1408161 RepID=A0A6A7B158_9PLEO|nr:hypothetical protein T440DRAFT_429426 [Plenodomus tracheiphilus IPT5]